MPIYEYRCEACGHLYEELQKISDPPLSDCPACEQTALKRLISAPSFRLKGSGWYETDFKSDKERKRNLVESGGDGGTSSANSPGGDGSKSESKPGDKSASADKAGSGDKSASGAKGDSGSKSSSDSKSGAGSKASGSKTSGSSEAA